jgi:hypothetical protein
MRRLPVLGLLLLLALVPATAAAKSKAKPKVPGILYSLDAKEAVISKSGGTFRISMGANTPVTWFTDRPDRRAGSVRLVDLYGIWDASGFVKDPPNAALLTSHEGVDRTHVVELTKPRLADGRVSFAIRATPEETAAGHMHSDELIAGTFARARLFIDDAALSPCPSSVGQSASGGVAGGLASLTTTTYQCLLAPGTKVGFTFTATSTIPTIVTACSTATTTVDVPNLVWGVAYALPCGKVDAFIVSSGLSGSNTIGAPDCPTPSASPWPIALPTTAAAAVRITVSSGKQVTCPQYVIGSTITITN